MATLTETAHYSRRVIAISLILLVGFIVVKVSFGLAKSVWLTLNPPPPPPPTVSFNKLPKLEFPEKEPGEAGPKLTYRLETIQGGLPELPDVDKVYLMPMGKSGLLALERGTEKARKMGFTGKPEALTETLHRWTNNDTPPVTLEMDVNTNEFHLHYPYETDQELLTAKNLPSEQQAIEEAMNFLRNNDFLTEELEEGEKKVSFRDLTPTGLIEAISLSEADFVRADFFRTDLDEFKIFPVSPYESWVSFLFSGSRKVSQRIVEIKYAYSPVEKETFGTYPLKPIANAWQEVQNGEAYIANLGQNQTGQVIIRRVYLAYYDASDSQDYLQPIYVFEGDNKFYAYSPAISPEWTK